MLRRRKSSCPDTSEHHNRRSSSAASAGVGGGNNRNGVKLDLYIEDDDIFAPGHSNRRKSPTPSNRSSPDYRYTATNIEEMAEEVLCLRLLSIRTRYRFGGLKIHIISPVFSIDKLFNVEFDQDSQVSLIKSQQCSGAEAPQTPPNDGSKMATIVISPDMDDFDGGGNAKLPTVNADLTLYEEPSTSHRGITLSANSLNRATELDQQTRLQSIANPLAAQVSSQLSFESDNVDFSNVKVYANLERGGSASAGSTAGNGNNNILEAIDLETKRDLKKKTSRGENPSTMGGGGKRSSMRRHTHYYCYIPSNIGGQSSGAAATGSRLNSGDKDSPNSNGGSGRLLKRYLGKKMTDTMHSASRFKKYLSDSLFSSK